MNYAVTLAPALVGWMLVWLAITRMNAVTRRTPHRWLRTLIWAPAAAIGLYLGLKPAMAEAVPQPPERSAKA